MSLRDGKTEAVAISCQAESCCERKGIGPNDAMVANDPTVWESRALPYAGRQAATEDKNADELATRHQNNEQRPAIHFYSGRPVQPRFKTAGRRQGAGRKTYGSGNTIPGSAAAPWRSRCRNG